MTKNIRDLSRLVLATGRGSFIVLGKLGLKPKDMPLKMGMDFKKYVTFLSAMGYHSCGVLPLTFFWCLYPF